jgi:flagellar assembly protein FliH
MSAKVLNGLEAAGAQLVQWPSVGDPKTNDEPIPAFRSLPAPVEVNLSPQVASLELELKKVKAEAEQRVNEALANGKREGEASARQALGVHAEAEIEKLKQLAKEMLACGPALRKQAEGDLVRLAVAIARRILHRELQVDSDALLGLTKAALGKIDQREIHVIRTHPDNVELIQRVLEQGRIQKRIEISGDARLGRGALIIETSRGQLDASVDTHLEEIERGFADLVGEQGQK